MLNSWVLYSWVLYSTCYEYVLYSMQNCYTAGGVIKEGAKSIKMLYSMLYANAI